MQEKLKALKERFLEEIKEINNEVALEELNKTFL